MLFLGAGATAIAHAQDEPGIAGVDAARIAQDGAALEAALDDAGIGAAWRAAVDLNGAARGMQVRYRGGGAAAVTSLVDKVVELDGVTTLHEFVVHQLRIAAGDLAAAEKTEREALIVRNRADAHLVGVNGLLGAVALDLFEGAYGADDQVLAFDNDAQVAALRDIEITTLTLEDMVERRRLAEIALADAEAALAEAVEETATRRAEHVRLDNEAVELRRTRTVLDGESRALVPAAAEAYVLAEITADPRMSPRALHAYVTAEQTMTELNPGCGITWRTIAAVGGVEGAHGSYGGRWLGMDGRPDTPILGLVLDGGVDNLGVGIASIADTDGGRWDGDPRFDRAVGPMQFIPQTWGAWGRDGDGDGEINPNDIDDATLGAAAYLCNYGSHRSWDAWKAAIFGYNHSVPYVLSVKSSFDRVAQMRTPDPDDGPALQPPAPAGVFVPPVPPPPPEPPPGEVPPGEAPPGEPPPSEPPAEAPAAPVDPPAAPADQ